MAYFNSEFGLKNFRIPDYILIPESKVRLFLMYSSCPVIVFINSKSRGSNKQGQYIAIQINLSTIFQAATIYCSKSSFTRSTR
ncbi:unnamed protein product, partial [Vitis vinifera]